MGSVASSTPQCRRVFDRAIGHQLVARACVDTQPMGTSLSDSMVSRNLVRPRSASDRVPCPPMTKRQRLGTRCVPDFNCSRVDHEGVSTLEDHVVHYRRNADLVVPSSTPASRIATGDLR